MFIKKVEIFSGKGKENFEISKNQHVFARQGFLISNFLNLTQIVLDHFCLFLSKSYEVISNFFKKINKAYFHFKIQLYSSDSNELGRLGPIFDIFHI
jgi:hypothetical protein